MAAVVPQLCERPEGRGWTLYMSGPWRADSEPAIPVKLLGYVFLHSLSAKQRQPPVAAVTNLHKLVGNFELTGPDDMRGSEFCWLS